MKQYRCPWCGKKGAEKKIRFFLDEDYGLPYHFGLKCTNCNKYYKTVFSKKGSLYELGTILIIVICVVFLALNLIFKINIVLLAILFSVFLAIANIYTIINTFLTSVLCRVGKNAHIQTQFLALLDKPLNLNVENIFTIRLKGISPQKIMAKSDLIGEYNQDGAPIYVEHQENNDYRIGMLNPLYYNLDVFAPDVEFDIYDTEGEVISTGRIIRSLG